MNRQRLLNIIAIIMLVVLGGIVAFSQLPPYSTEIWMTVKDDANPSDFMRMRFGNCDGATYGIDNLNPTLVEKEGPPLSPGFDCRWVNIPGRTNVYGAGLLYYNFRETDNWPNRKDTFVVLFQNPDNSTANFTLKWPDAEYLALRCDSMFMVDPTGQIPKVNMFTQDSLWLHAPGSLDLPITKLRIFKYGGRLIDDVRKENQPFPNNFALLQNFPNPLNPNTIIQYALPHESRVTLRVYNVLGEVVETLVDGVQRPGYISVVWRADGLPSGIYYYRLAADTYVETRKLILLR